MPEKAMTDLVQKFREAVKYHDEWKHSNIYWGTDRIAQWLSEAADEIERLEELEKLWISFASNPTPQNMAECAKRMDAITGSTPHD